MLRIGLLLSLLATAFGVSLYRVFMGFADMHNINRAQDRIIQDAQIWASKLTAHGIDPSYLLPIDQPSYGIPLFSIISGGILAVLAYVTWCELFLIFRVKVNAHEKLYATCEDLLARANSEANEGADIEDYDAALQATTTISPTSER